MSWWKNRPFLWIFVWTTLRSPSDSNQQRFFFLNQTELCACFILWLTVEVENLIFVVSWQMIFWFDSRYLIGILFPPPSLSISFTKWVLYVILCYFYNINFLLKFYVWLLGKFCPRRKSRSYCLFQREKLKQTISITNRVYTVLWLSSYVSLWPSTALG